MLEIEFQVRTMSNGTFATLTDEKDCSKLDLIRADFLQFVTERPNQFASWQIAWKAYTQQD